ncbi:MAG TPA: hypothetical protein VGS21_07070 [Acidimicrobiales bacterium]|nr:hypothetical protein [Acidimicrobiales bacterium]
MTELLDEAADTLERHLFFDRFSSRYAELREDEPEWHEVEEERASESGALSDQSL